MRTALSGEIKSVDVTWEGIPNAFARIFEINLGIIGACVPIMKPLFRYIHAKATGQDPHNVLYRTNTPSKAPSPSTWYQRLRFGSRGYGSSSSKPPPWNQFHAPSPQTPPGQDLATQQSLGLPIEGPKVETHMQGEVPILHEEKSKRSLQSQLAPRYEAQDQV